MHDDRLNPGDGQPCCSSGERDYGTLRGCRGTKKTRLAGGLSIVGRADGFAGPAQQGLDAAQTRAAFSAALSVGLGRITALHFSESAL